jgi:hypothetical protein
MIGLLVRETIALRRAYDCEHAWQPLSDASDGAQQCSRCGVIATPEGKRELARAADRFHGRPHHG